MTLYKTKCCWLNETKQKDEFITRFWLASQETKDCGELSEFGLCLPGPNWNVETEFWVKEKKIGLLLCQAKEGHGRLMPLRLFPLLGRTAGSVIVKRGKTGFWIRISVGGKYTLFLCGAGGWNLGLVSWGLSLTLVIFWVIMSGPSLEMKILARRAHWLVIRAI